MASPQVRKAADAPIAAEPDLSHLMTTYGGRLRRYFARRAATCDVDDLVQDVFLHMHAARLRAPIIDVERYLFTVAHHVLVSLCRSHTARRWRSHDPLDSAPEPSSDLSPERILVARQEYARAVMAMNALPPRARAAFQLHRFEELSYAAIAERMGISRESVKELLRRASDRLGQVMRPQT
jgi:RNA polymerase sigma factor (sigma-70 family)